MPPRLGQIYPVTFAGKPPHMIGRDLGLWAQWRQNLPFPYEGFYFDAALGTPPEPDPSLRPGTNAAWQFLTARRIDAVGILPDRYHVIEIRRGADQSAIGALEIYCHLWAIDPPDRLPCFPVLVTDLMDTDARAFARTKPIIVFELSKPEKPPTLR